MTPDFMRFDLMRSSSMPKRSAAIPASILICCVLAVSGCSTVKGWFGGGKDEKKAL